MDTGIKKSDGGYTVEHDGRTYTLSREDIDTYGVPLLTYLIMMGVDKTAQEVEVSRVAHIYHNAEAANETCLEEKENVEAQK